MATTGNGLIMQEAKPFSVTALVLAGARPGRDPVADIAGGFD